VAGFLLSYSIFSCVQSPQEDDPASIEQSLPGDFMDFIEKFQTDSSYQMDHITFPLMGLPSGSDSTNSLRDFRWHRDDWVLHRAFEDPNNAYMHDYIMVDDQFIIERIRLKAAPFGMERRFARLGEEWNLIYYAAMNQMKKNTK
jgi:hypothetical protein